MIRVLHEVACLDGGGVAKLLLDYYSHIDHAKVHFDFLIYDYYQEGIYERPLRDMGCTIYTLPIYKKNRLGCLSQMREILKNGKYDAVHSHRGSRGLFVLYYAKRFGVRWRIAHSHISYEPAGRLKRLLNITLAKTTKLLATDLFACGSDAGQYMWGKAAMDAKHVQIMKNAIDVRRFAFSVDKRRNMRAELGLTDEFAIGIVGRLSAQKNHRFALRAFAELLKRREHAVLVVVGRGEEEQELRALAHRLKLIEKIRFLGVRNDVPELLHALDAFVLPSLYEGLPVVLMEQQANGLPAIISERITDELNITDLLHVLPIDDGAEVQWAERLDVIAGTTPPARERYAHIVREAGYDIATVSRDLQAFYEQMDSECDRSGRP